MDVKVPPRAVAGAVVALILAAMSGTLCPILGFVLVVLTVVTIIALITGPDKK